VACETCHGPAQGHIDDIAVFPVVDDSREFCGKCHEDLFSRPKDFPQVDLAVHNPGTACLTCHNPHRPTFGSVSASHTADDTVPDTGADTPDKGDGTPDTGNTSPDTGDGTPDEGVGPPDTGGDTPDTGEAPKDDPALPAIPHSLEGRENCLMCHGPQGFKPNPPDHEGRTNETCLSCHRSDT
jgi:hypothetical protein